MLYCCIEINGYDQLARVKPYAAEQILSVLDERLATVAFRIVLRQGDLFLYGTDERDPSVGGVIHVLMQIQEHLRGLRRSIQGFSLLLDTDAAPPGEALHSIKSALFSTVHDGSIYIGSAAWPAFSRSVTAEEEGNLFRVIRETGVEEISKPSPPGRIHRKKIVDQIGETLGPLINGEDPPGMVLVTGPAGYGKRDAIDESLKLISAGLPGCEWLRLYTTCANPSWLHPFLNGISPVFLEKVPSFLSVEERALWEEKKNLLTFLCTDHLSEDFYSVYYLYISAYIGFMKKNLLPCFMICEDIGTFHPDAVRFLQRLWKEFIPQAGLIPIVTGTEEEIPQTMKTGAIHLGIGPLDEGEIGSFLLQCPVQGLLAEKLMSDMAGFTVPSVIRYLNLVAGGEGVQKPVSERSILASVIKGLAPPHRRVLYAFALSEGMLSHEEIAGFISSRDLAQGKEREIIGELERLTLLRIRTYPTVSDTAIEPLLVKQLERESKRIADEFADYIYSLWENGKYPRVKFLLRFLQKTGDSTRTNLIFFSLLSRSLDEGNSDYAIGSLLEAKLVHPSSSSSAPPNPGEFDDYMGRALFIRAYTIRGDFASAQRYSLGEQEAADLSRDWAGEIELESAKLARALGNEKLALERTKRVLLHAQGTGNRRLLSSANIEIGLIMLNSEKCEEAMEYFIIARDAAEQSGSSFEMIRALTYEALSHFIFGNLSKAIRQIDAALAFIERATRREWQMYLLFLKGRVQFELGIYDQATATFQTALSLCDIYSHKERKKLFYAWMARAQIYGSEGEPLKVLRNLVKDSEVLFFMSEAYLLAGDAERALNLLESAFNTRPKPGTFHPGETIPWENGFAGIEDRAIPTPDGRGFLSHLLRAFRGYLFGCAGDREAGMGELSRITREDKLSENDPNNHLYYLFYSLILPPKTEPENVDKLTILSKALKYIQQRASRIDEVLDKQAYLGRNLWNVRLMGEARKNKLI